MSFLKRIFRIGDDPAESAPVSHDKAAAPALASTSPVADDALSRAASEPPIEARNIGDILRVEETTSAEFFVGDLFRRKFRGDPPNYPKHYVAFYRAAPAAYWPIGYVHYTAFEDTFLCGGMVMDDRLYRRVPNAHRKLIKEVGGVAEFMLRETFARLAHAPAIWGYVGDRQAEEVDMRVGFRHTRHPHVMVVWNQDLPEHEKEARLERAIALGPF